MDTLEKYRELARQYPTLIADIIDTDPIILDIKYKATLAKVQEYENVEKIRSIYFAALCIIELQYIYYNISPPLELRTNSRLAYIMYTRVKNVSTLAELKERIFLDLTLLLKQDKDGAISKNIEKLISFGDVNRWKYNE